MKFRFGQVQIYFFSGVVVNMQMLSVNHASGEVVQEGIRPSEAQSWLLGTVLVAVDNLDRVAGFLLCAFFIADCAPLLCFSPVCCWFINKGCIGFMVGFAPKKPFL